MIKDKRGLRFLQQSKYQDLKEFNDKNLKGEDLQVDLNYITQHQVRRKRKELFTKKIFYQNQLTALKEKGKRLLMCEKIDRQTRKQAKDYLSQIEKKEGHRRTNSEQV